MFLIPHPDIAARLMSFRHIWVLPLIAVICRMIALGVLAAMVIEGVLPHFGLLVRGDGLMQDVIEPVTRAPPQPMEQLSPFLSIFLVIGVGHLLV
jgi:hypothetical protein